MIGFKGDGGGGGGGAQGRKKNIRVLLVIPMNEWHETASGSFIAWYKDFVPFFFFCIRWIARGEE